MIPICFGCLYFFHTSEPMACLAYPDGIPDAILMGEADHNYPLPGDNGIQFKQA